MTCYRSQRSSAETSRRLQTPMEQTAFMLLPTRARQRSASTWWKNCSLTSTLRMVEVRCLQFSISE